jgi:superfamily I DNA and/or RNA helicase
MKVADSLIALSSIRRGGRVLLCGDHRQLAPIVRGSYDEENPLFGSAFALFVERFGRMALRESRRMNGPLVAYPRRTFYPGLVSVQPGRRLAVAPPAEGTEAMDALIRDAFLRPEDSVVFCTYSGYTATARNPFEARLAARIATLARDGLRDPATGEAYTADGFREQGLAILSPHRAQNSAILHELARAGWAYGELPIVDTVERMQGNEREMILVSYAVADREYAEREAEFLLDPHRFNVAITRPRAKLVLLMSGEVLRALSRDERVMTGSMAVKGYLRQPWRRVREMELPSPDGGTVTVTLRVR